MTSFITPRALGALPLFASGPRLPVSRSSCARPKALLDERK
jgi:hypothetical protein